MLLVGVLVAVMSGAVSFMRPLEYRAVTKVFIIAKTQAGVDPFTLAKTGEHVGASLRQLVYTSSFLKEVARIIGQDIPRGAWQKKVDVDMIPGTGFMQIAAYDTDTRFAGVLAQAVATALTQRGPEYAGSEIEIKEVDAVVVSRYPVRPNILMNMAIGFLLGAFGVFVFELFRMPRGHYTGAVDWLRHL